MNTGRLDQRVLVERLTIVQDPNTGAVTEGWVTVASTWAAVEPLNGREFFAASTALSEVTTRIRLRYRPGFSVTDRVTHEGTQYDITSIINPRSSDRELVLMCKASVA